MTERDVQGVCAVAVTYHPDAAALHELLSAVSGQVGMVLIVDNTDNQDAVFPDVSAWAGRVQVQRQNQNLGLGAAQNMGIEWARVHGYRHVLLLDQDSVPSDGMVPSLLAASERLREDGKVAAVGPVFHDLREHAVAPFVLIRPLVNRKVWCEREGQVVACDFLISSGSLIALDVIEAIGGMDAGLFIDNVDLEWSFRARAKGYALYGICAASMHHRLGDARRALPLGLGQVVVHGPVRLYFMMRNRIRLYRMPHVPRAWVTQDVPRVFVKLMLFGVLFGPRLRNLRHMLRGIGDGLRGREGPYPLDG